MCTQTQLHIDVNISKHACKHIYTYMQTQLHVNINTPIHTHKHTYSYSVHLYKHIYPHTSSDLHTYMQTQHTHALIHIVCAMTHAHLHTVHYMHKCTNTFTATHAHKHQSGKKPCTGCHIHQPSHSHVVCNKIL